MIFTDEKEIFELILKPKNKGLIDYQWKKKETAELHLFGWEIKEFIAEIYGIKDENYIKVRQKFVNEYTTKIYEKALRPMDSLFTAKGGGRVFDTDTSKNQAIKDFFSKKIGKEYTLDEWIGQVWRMAIFSDPFGLTFIETDPETEQFYLKQYSVYKRNQYGEEETEIIDIDYSTPDTIEYIVFDWGKDEKDNQFYRVVDDKMDYLVKQEKGKTGLEAFSIVYDIDGIKKTFPHTFGKVPAVFNSYKKDFKMEKALEGYADKSFVIANELLNNHVDQLIYKNKLAIPRFWEFKSACTKCNGTREIQFEKSIIVCDKCKGVGYETERSLTDMLYVTPMDKDTQAIIPPSGSVTMPTDILEQLLTIETNQEIDINDTIWGYGTYAEKERKDTTAFEISVRNETKVQKLKEIAENKVYVEKAIIRLIGKGQFGTEFKDIYITAPTQYILNTGTEAMEIYKKARVEGSPNSLLDQLYNEYLISEYDGNPKEYDRQRKLFLLEPYPHNTLLEIKDIATPLEFTIKKNFEKYIAIIEQSMNIAAEDLLKLKLELEKQGLEDIAIYGYDKDSYVKIKDRETLDSLEADQEALKEQRTAQANLRGTVGGVQGIIEVLRGVNEGITDQDSAIAILEEIYGFSYEVAQRIVTNKSQTNKQSNNVVSQTQNDMSAGDDPGQ